MDGKQLKNSILQEAIQGRLVPQDASEEPASVLLERVEEERQRLIREKKIKKPKTTSRIFRRDGHFYESKNGGDPVCIDEEIPFEIPTSWEWVRLGGVIHLKSGQDLTPDKYNSSKRGIPYITGASNFNSGNVVINRWTEYPSSVAYKGDLLLTCKGTVGSMAVLQVKDAHIARQIMALSIMVIDLFYVQFFLESSIERLKSAAKGVIPGISREDILTSLFPLPPYSEQKRIVAKLEKLMLLVEHYGKHQKEAEMLDMLLPDALRKAIIQEAIQGKLVPQDDSEEPASVLLERIAVERAKLGKKTAKPMSRIVRRGSETNPTYHEIFTDGSDKDISDEIPFSIPKNWAWCRVGEIFTLQAGKFIKASDISQENSKEIFPCYGGHGLRGYVNKFNRDGEFPIIGRQGALCGNVIIAKGKFYATEHAVVVETPVEANVLWAYYFLQALNLNQYATATAQPGLAVANINQVFIPIPPTQEQKRIVAKIKRILHLIEL